MYVKSEGMLLYCIQYTSDNSVSDSPYFRLIRTISMLSTIYVQAFVIKGTILYRACMQVREMFKELILLKEKFLRSFSI